MNIVKALNLAKKYNKKVKPQNAEYYIFYKDNYYMCKNKTDVKYTLIFLDDILSEWEIVGNEEEPLLIKSEVISTKEFIENIIQEYDRIQNKMK